MNQHLNQLRLDTHEYFALGEQKRNKIRKTPWDSVSSGPEVAEERRLSNLEYDIRQRVLTDKNVMALALGLVEPTVKFTWEYFYDQVVTIVKEDLGDAPSYFYEDEQKNEEASKIIQKLQTLLEEEPDWVAISQTADLVGGILDDWYEDGEGGDWVSDDGYDYFCGALQNLEWLASFVAGGYNLTEFNQYVADAARDYGNDIKYEGQACDGEPRYGWVYKIYCAHVGLKSRDD